GLVDEDENGWAPSQLLSLSAYGKSLRRQPARLPTTELIRAGEKMKVEFKGSFEADLKGRGIPAKDMQWNCIKSILGFLNREGGSLLIGIADDGERVGLSADLEKVGGSQDKLQLRINNALSSTLGDGVTSSLTITYEGAANELICRIDVPKSQNLVFLRQDFSKGKTHEL